MRQKIENAVTLKLVSLLLLIIKELISQSWMIKNLAEDTGIMLKELL